MPLPYDQFLKRLAILSDASLLCDVLNISPEDIIERFEDVIEDNIEELREAFDVDFQDYEREEFDDE